MSHTPGPWGAPYLDTAPGDEGWWIHNGRQGSDEFAIAVTFELNPNAEADARLIAAAPELLAALKELAARCDGAEGVRADGSNIQTMHAHAAIAKAEGK